MWTKLLGTVLSHERIRNPHRDEHLAITIPVSIAIAEKDPGTKYARTMPQPAAFTKRCCTSVMSYSTSIGEVSAAFSSALPPRPAHLVAFLSTAAASNIWLQLMLAHMKLAFAGFRHTTPEIQGPPSCLSQELLLALLYATCTWFMHTRIPCLLVSHCCSAMVIKARGRPLSF